MFATRYGLATVFFVTITICSTLVLGQGNRPPAFASPEIESGTAIFRLFAPEAESVTLVGSDFPSAGPGPAPAAEFEKGENGVWEARRELPPGAYRYQFIVDGVTTLDAKNTDTSASNNNMWSLLTVPGDARFDTVQVNHGAVAEVQYYSEPLERMRRMHVYTPPGYEKGDQAYPVFYLLHGASDSDDSWSTVGRANIIIDNLIAEGKVAPMIVVMPNGHTGSFAWGGGGKPFDQQMKEFVDDFNQAIRPYVESHYRVKEGRENRAIAGLSMGGAQTLNISFSDLEDYAYIGVFSSGVFGIAGGFNREPDDSWEEQRAEALGNAELKKNLKLVWFGIGSEDFLLETSRATVKMLKGHDFDVVEKETDGGHTWKNWRDYLHEFSQKLFQD